jgi:hypothetical protein
VSGGELPAGLDARRLLTTDQAALYLGVAASSLKTCRTRGGGPVATRVGRRTVRYRVADLDAWTVAEARTPAPAERRPGGQPGALRSAS